MSTNRDIRDRYREIIRALAKEHGEEGSGYYIDKNATLARCLKYTMDFVVKGTKIHYRYSMYKRALQYNMDKHPANSNTLIHLDIGCGPGLFSWVVADYFRSKSSIDVELYGYDYAPKMVKLARLIRKLLGEDERYSCHHKKEKLIRLLRESKANRPYILVTCGHVLIQTSSNHKAQADFAQIIAKLAQLADCQIVAVDAHTGNRPQQFLTACDRLKDAMEKKGLIVDNPHIVESEMWTVARARRRA